MFQIVVSTTSSVDLAMSDRLLDRTAGAGLRQASWPSRRRDLILVANVMIAWTTLSDATIHKDFSTVIHTFTARCTALNHTTLT